MKQHDTLDIQVFPQCDFPAELARLAAEWSAAIFSAPELQHPWARLEIEWAQPAWRLFVFHAGEPVSHLALVDTTVQVGTTRRHVGGVSAVMTPMQWRGRGFVYPLMREAAVVMRARMAADSGLLSCSERLLPLYARCGWGRIEAPVYFRQSFGRVLWEEETMFLPVLEPDWPPGEIDLLGPAW